VARVPVILVPLRLPAVTAPVTAKEDKVPTLVSELDTTEVPRAVAVKTLTLPMRYAVPVLTTWLECRLATATLPVTSRVPKVPTLVMLGWAAVWSVPTKLVPDSVVPVTFPAATLPVTAKEDNVPTLVMLGWAAVARVPVILVPLRLPAVTAPVTAKDDNVPTLVMLG
jgi:hypothetical protein